MRATKKTPLSNEEILKLANGVSHYHPFYSKLADLAGRNGRVAKLAASFSWAYDSDWLEIVNALSKGGHWKAREGEVPDRLWARYVHARRKLCGFEEGICRRLLENYPAFKEAPAWMQAAVLEKAVAGARRAAGSVGSYLAGVSSKAAEAVYGLGVVTGVALVGSTAATAVWYGLEAVERWFEARPQESLLVFVGAPLVGLSLLAAAALRIIRDRRKLYKAGQELENAIKDGAAEAWEENRGMLREE